MSASLAERKMNEEKLSLPCTPVCSHVPGRHGQQVRAKIHILAKPISEQSNHVNVLLLDCAHFKNAF